MKHMIKKIFFFIIMVSLLVGVLYLEFSGTDPVGESYYSIKNK